MEQIRYLDSKRFKEFLKEQAAKNNKSINKLIQDNLRACFNKEKDFKK
jgi:hypothetical protein